MTEHTQAQGGVKPRRVAAREDGQQALAAHTVLVAIYPID